MPHSTEKAYYTEALQLHHTQVQTGNKIVFIPAPFKWPSCFSRSRCIHGVLCHKQLAPGVNLHWEGFSNLMGSLIGLIVRWPPETGHCWRNGFMQLTEALQIRFSFSSKPSLAVQETKRASPIQWFWDYQQQQQRCLRLSKTRCVYCNTRVSICRLPELIKCFCCFYIFYLLSVLFIFFHANILQFEFFSRRERY